MDVWMTTHQHQTHLDEEDSRSFNQQCEQLFALCKSATLGGGDRGASNSQTLMNK
jgi:hypothetical protein